LLLLLLLLVLAAAASPDGRLAQLQAHSHPALSLLLLPPLQDSGSSHSPARPHALLKFELPTAR
jgi:hypothetical protein